MRNKNILLVEPNWESETSKPLKPLALLRISSMHKSFGNKVKYVQGEKPIKYNPHIIYVTSIWTYKYPQTIRCIRYYKNRFPKAKMIVGGILASMMPKLLEKEDIEVHKGLWEEIEKYPPDYTLFPNLGYSLTFATRGCINKCGFCIVPKLEGNIRSMGWHKDINIKFPKIIFLDNNWLAKNKKDWLDDVKHLKELCKKGIKEIDFNQSLDCRIMSPWHLKQIQGLPINPIRFSFDHMGQNKSAQKTIKLCKKYGFTNIFFDVLFNWTDSPEDFYYRIKEISRLGCVAIPMRYSPINQITRDNIGSKWTKQEVEAVNKINPYQFGQISSRNLGEFEYFFGKNAKEFKRLLNFKDISKLQTLKMKKWMRKKL